MLLVKWVFISIPQAVVNLAKFQVALIAETKKIVNNANQVMFFKLRLSANVYPAIANARHATASPPIVKPVLKASQSKAGLASTPTTSTSLYALVLH